MVAVGLRGPLMLHGRRRSANLPTERQIAMSIELYAWNTPNGRKISVALEEMGLPYSVHPVNISKGEQFSPEFLEISPNNRIPAIVDREGPGGAPISIFESGAILIYLGEKTGKFWPADLRRQVPVLEWLMWQMGGFGPMPGQVHHFVQVENEADRRYGLERYTKETRRLYGVLDKRLGEVEYAGGDISIADFAILGWAWRHERHLVALADFPDVGRWYETMMARPGVKRGFAVALG
jgi:GSH-dependent disulfide-bond oxidoreductase